MYMHMYTYARVLVTCESCVISNSDKGGEVHSDASSACSAVYRQCGEWGLSRPGWPQDWRLPTGSKYKLSIHKPVPIPTFFIVEWLCCSVCSFFVLFRFFLLLRALAVHYHMVVLDLPKS